MSLTRRHLLAAASAWPWISGVASAEAADEALVAPSPALAPVAAMLSSDAHPGIDPSAYLVSEKLDGVRALWNGQSLHFRSGRPIATPPGFTSGWPRVPLDGELWIARGRFQAVSGTVRREQPDAAAWRQVRYEVFDLPGAPEPFAARARRLRDTLQALTSTTLHPVDHRRLTDAAALQRLLTDVVRSGGEGLMLHRADAVWQPGRSDALLKLKPVQDAEATVTGHEAGQGRHAGRLGALRVRTPAGLEFRLGTGFTDAEREAPPPIGSVVTYTYQGLTDTGRPRFARYLRPRDDA